MLVLAAVLAVYAADLATHLSAMAAIRDLVVYRNGAQFTYPPFAAVVFAVASVLPWTLLRWVMTLASLAAPGLPRGLTFGTLGCRASPGGPGRRHVRAAAVTSLRSVGDENRGGLEGMKPVSLVAACGDDRQPGDRPREPADLPQDPAVAGQLDAARQPLFLVEENAEEIGGDLLGEAFALAAVHPLAECKMRGPGSSRVVARRVLAERVSGHVRGRVTDEHQRQRAARQAPGLIKTIAAPGRCGIYCI